MNAITVRDVTKRFGKFVAVQNLSFEVRQNTIFGLLGPNGAGKTTTIRMIINIYMPNEGEILLLGQRLTPALQHRIGYLPEERGLYNRKKVGDQLLFFGRLKGMEKNDALRGIDYWLEKLELTEWKNRAARDLSKGMRQKVQFIAAVLHDPDLLILDEPFSGLDPVSVSAIKEVIIDLKRKGKTVIFSTHQMEQVEQMCDEVCLINHGTMVLGGGLHEVKRQFGGNVALLDFGGGDSFLTPELAKRIDRYPNYVELLLNCPADGQEILKRAISSGAFVNRFHLVERSLNDIFIETIGGSNGKNKDDHCA